MEFIIIGLIVFLAGLYLGSGLTVFLGGGMVLFAVITLVKHYKEEHGVSND